MSGIPLIPERTQKSEISDAVKIFLSILKTSANQTTPFKVWWRIVFLILRLIFESELGY